MSEVVTFWTGSPLSRYEQLSLASFARRNHAVKIYTYEPELITPNGVELRDANEILPLSGLAADLIERGAFALLSDVIRYRLLRAGLMERTWVDTDIVLLSDDLPAGEYLFAWEGPKMVNSAVLRAPSESVLLNRLLGAVAGLDAHDAVAAPWGSFGPKLLTRFVDELGLKSHALFPHTLYPIHYSQVWRLFDPASRDWCLSVTHQASALHLWNEFIRRAGLRDRRPPDESFLAELFAENEIEWDAAPVRESEIQQWAKEIDPSQQPLFNRVRKRLRKLAKRSIA